MDRYFERLRRRRQINEVLKFAVNYKQAIKIIYFLNGSLRTTCILDIEEFLYTKDKELASQNPWWSKYNLETLMLMLKESGIC